jgi:hypothetical protein
MVSYLKIALGLFVLGSVSFTLCLAQSSACAGKPRFEVEASKDEVKQLKARITEFIRAYQTEDLDQVANVLPVTSAGQRKSIIRHYSNDFVSQQIHGIAEICLSTVSTAYPHYFAVANGTLVYQDRTRRPEAIFFYISKSTDERIPFKFTELMFARSDIFELAPNASIPPKQDSLFLVSYLIGLG